MASQVTIYSTRLCPYCIRAKALLESKHIEYTEIGVDAQPALRRAMMRRSGRSTVPQIWIDDRHIGGYDDLALLERRGELDGLLQLAS